MPQHLFDLLRAYLARYGYGAVAGALLLENAGLPVPGETILLLASFTAYSEHRLQLDLIIAVAITAATVGDNLGFAIGFYGGRPLLDRYRQLLHLRPSAIEQGERLFQRYGAVTIFFARFIAGLRIIAGPLAGVLRMSWRRFLLFNFLGATVWVTVVASVGYLFGRHWEELSRVSRNANLITLMLAAILVLFLWWKRRKRGS
jgi:membrane protein DedA with SNARE-associated domain